MLLSVFLYTVLAEEMFLQRKQLHKI